MKILLATDGSEYSTAAVKECCEKIIKPEGTELLIVSVYEDTYPIMAEPFAMSAEYYQNIEESVRELCEQHINGAREMVDSYFASTPLVVTTEILRGAPDQQIVERAKEWNADLIVVGSHGRGFWGRLLGSVSTGVVHHAPCSVLVVRNVAE